MTMEDPNVRCMVAFVAGVVCFLAGLACIDWRAGLIATGLVVAGLAVMAYEDPKGKD